MRSKLLSFLAHLGLVALFVVIPAKMPRPPRELLPKPEPRRVIRLQMAPSPSSKPGGGGGQMKRPASRGPLPRFAQRQFVPPTTTIVNLQPKLPMEPTLVVEKLQSSPTLTLVRFGDPAGSPGPPSDGSGRRGIGNGGGGDGVGDGDGPMAGGEGFGGALNPPVVIYMPDPEFSEDARKAKLEGTVVLDAVVDPTGRTTAVRVRNGLGLGLDEKAIEAVRTWRFRPGTRSGRTVAVPVVVHVNFRLL